MNSSSLASSLVQISKITRQVKDQNRYSIFVDGGYSFSLSTEELLNSGLAQGRELTKDELKKLKELSNQDKIYNAVLKLLARRARSRWEIEEYLKRKGADARTSEYIINKLEDLSYVDDYRFATSWVESRRLLKPISKRKLIIELRQKRIPAEIIDEVLSQNEVDELAQIKELVEKKHSQTRYQDETKLTQYLIRQGFNYGDVKQALNELKNHNN